MAPSPMAPRDHRSFIETELQSSAAIQQATAKACTDDILKAVQMLVGSVRHGGKILFCGNGGSAADCQHLATELVVRLNPAMKRPGIPAIALTTDTSFLTAGANDLGYDQVFARGVEALGAKGDVLVGITTSGKSESINNALRAAHSKGMATLGLLGKGGGTTRELVDIAIIVPSDDTQRIQESHIAVGHILCALTERELYG